MFIVGPRPRPALAARTERVYLSKTILKALVSGVGSVVISGATPRTASVVGRGWTLAGYFSVASVSVPSPGYGCTFSWLLKSGQTRNYFYAFDATDVPATLAVAQVNSPDTSYNSGHPGQLFNLVYRSKPFLVTSS